MKKNSSEHEPTLGFVTITDDQSVGYIGGYLLLNSRARPLEFHCTAPVQPSRAQEILYGAILKSYLYGEQIAGALLARAKIVPDLLISDIAEIAEARPLEGVPTFLLTATPSTADEGGTQIRVHGACDGTAAFCHDTAGAQVALLFAGRTSTCLCQPVLPTNSRLPNSIGLRGGTAWRWMSHSCGFVRR